MWSRLVPLPLALALGLAVLAGCAEDGGSGKPEVVMAAAPIGDRSTMRRAAVSRSRSRSTNSVTAAW